MEYFHKSTPFIILTSCSYDFVLPVKLIADFHGIAYALKLNNRPAFDAIKDKFREARYHEGACFGAYETVIRNGPLRGTRSVREHNDDCKVPEEFLKKLETVLNDTIQYQKDKFLPVEPMAVLCHGDFLRNNIAFKYSDEVRNGTKQSIRVQARHL